MRVPVTIVSGYLGAGKTTLINRLLREDHGLHLTVLVNDFGAINIDAALIAGSNVESVALANGCVCCSLSDDLAQSINQALTGDIRPDHIVIEASGVADPVAIANVLLEDRRLSYSGVVTVVDSCNVDRLLCDPVLQSQVTQQIRAADIVLISKLEAAPSEALLAQLRQCGARAPTSLNDISLSQMLFDIVPLPRDATPVPHPGYVSWQHRSTRVLDRRALGDKLAARPEGLYRMKGFVLTSGGAYELHIVGRHVEARRCEAEETLLVGLGPEKRISRDQIEAWWSGA
ncbi:CobW family GTP-binding protein [Tritonibacter horizontis]|uniref:Putative GTP-binding protein YjiA n=1 Tax=Tritonibacter horizontis TaxID=1768241 RepID=A0A132BWN1_9RHOB|nr:CobW family GTP-binding protein [Tritonibacter horizontis]KUP92793.1 putative GTP-binding protein YjiA [Tritonibacter horizontis]